MTPRCTTSSSPFARRAAEHLGEAGDDAAAEGLAAFAAGVDEVLRVGLPAPEFLGSRVSISSRVQPSQSPKSTSSNAATAVGTCRPPATSVAPRRERCRRLA